MIEITPKTVQREIAKLKERFIDERTGIEYRIVGDYYLPNILLPKPRRTGNIGKYGRLKYLEEHHRPEIMLMRVNNELAMCRRNCMQ